MPPTSTPTDYSLEQLAPSPASPRNAGQRILAQAAGEAERIREQARTEGRTEGRAIGQADTLAATEALREALRELTEMRAQIAAAVELDAVELALALAAKILSGVLEVQPERVVDVVMGALRRVNERRRIAVLVNPADLELVNASVEELILQAGGIELCEVQSDRRVPRGGAVVRTLECEVDATVPAQLERAREIVLEELRAGGAETPHASPSPEPHDEPQGIPAPDAPEHAA
ncbi:MAG TPA: FliH/SctL family protein [Solirubrobacteraceae bacterium]|jgi:flagellar assembly protein FliH|nr:FliH/SctL family protein [Solirubrobacteraceae bacterium]